MATFTIPPELRQAAKNAMEDVFDAWKKAQPIRFYKVAVETVVAFDPNYNAYFQEQTSISSVTRDAQYQDIYARIWYENRQEFADSFGGGDDVGIRTKQLYNRIRVQIRYADFDWLKETEKFIFWDEEYVPELPPIRVGILDTDQFVEIVLKRSN